MKKIKALFLIFTMLSSLSSYAIEGLEIGATLMGSRSNSNGEFEVDGVLFMTYEGYEYGISDDKALNILPTAVEVSVGGKHVKAYTDAATLQYYGLENLELAISAVSIDYNKFNDFAIRETEKVALAEVSATKFFEVGSIDIDVSAIASFGGYTKTETLRGTETIDYKDTHFYTIEGGIGANLPVTDNIDLYVYGGGYYQQGDETSRNGTYFGAETEIFSGVIAKDVYVAPYVEYVSERVTFGSSGNDHTNDDIVRFGVRVRF